ncbi:MAG: helix-turn-helix transcriptional regulator [Spirochaetaceae bacterium]|jgi:transcriptional regulator with XRE-family HTH domain|nr:helix-turn-helix transcriptional regulator [Spirochaetaceae bacterium]
MKERRRILGLSQSKLAERLNAAPTYIAMIEAKKKFPSVEMLERIAAALQVDSPELFSVQSYPSESAQELRRTLLSDFEKFIQAKLKEIQDV